MIDLNSDLGEGDTDDEALLQIVTSANVACGHHAGSATDLVSRYSSNPATPISRPRPDCL